ncbi:uncharacterized protein DNG_02453 [Cephalotrichum gorgonifer]|uniref:Uncharacterized protein n=1 Tax=Cephalotrichum gorgonifer TaxID=2041049 RepID=A0AAE8MTY9_9PEZI|nr:uncharacterized protein DNG_02453 [Cephalotrichum gorgonifer]
MNDIGDAAPEWIIAPASAAAILETFHEVFGFLPAPAAPSLRSSSSTTSSASSSPSSQGGPGSGPVFLLEEYDPSDLGRLNAPYAYVADHVARVAVSVDVAAEMAAYEERARSGGSASGGGETARKEGGEEVVVDGKGWFERLRDQLQAGEEIGWYVVVCGDEERDTGSASGSGSEDEDKGVESTEREEGGEPGGLEELEEGHRGGGPVEAMKPERKRGLRRLFGKRGENAR